MKKRKFNKVMKTIGKKEGRSGAEVEREIQIAIDSAFSSPDPEIRAEWTKVPFKGEYPTVQEVLEYLSEKVKKNQ